MDANGILNASAIDKTRTASRSRTARPISRSRSSAWCLRPRSTRSRAWRRWSTSRRGMGLNHPRMTRVARLWLGSLRASLSPRISRSSRSLLMVSSRGSTRPRRCPGRSTTSTGARGCCQPHRTEALLVRGRLARWVLWRVPRRCA